MNPAAPGEGLDTWSVRDRCLFAVFCAVAFGVLSGVLIGAFLLVVDATVPA